ncbi:peptidoglycan DD-metalloendopeptidase family protein [Olivibacter sp. SDN3]|uniref:M23 family metallopeptidase n=1 Tax=Olivibacter sp. SDN3 TaxID=2764720 RepID=UPI00165129C7|nr:M23 family metallopeptidase [Olivibacter sp. SDN3]QNL49022.1 peptidoglycan DD-metalloendopeptidase family protein [Olivibacter sp. SDN3]
MKKKGRQSLSEPINVLVLDQHASSEKIKSVPYGLLLYWRRLILAFICLSVFLIVAVLFFASHNYFLLKSSERLQSELKEAREYPKQMETVQSKMQELEGKMEKVNTYLSKRGIERVTAEGGQGGLSEELTGDNIEEVLDQYNFYADSLHRDLSNVPLGYPIQGPLTSVFGIRSNPFSKRGIEAHGGVDIKAKRGAVVKAPAQGKVLFAGWKGGYGRCVVIEHDKGFETLYGHLSAIQVKPHQMIDAGHIIGKVGSTGRSTGPHLHYEITRHGKKINPGLFLKDH